MVEEREVSFKDILSFIGRFFKFLLSKWYVLLFVLIIGGLAGYFIAISLKPKYKAVLSFVLSTETKGNGIAGLASQFGLDLGGTTGGDLFTGDNIITLFQSKKMIRAVLFKKPPEKNETLLNIIVKEWKWDKDWDKKAHLKNLFPFAGDPRLINIVQDSLINEVYENIIKNNLSVSRVDKKLSVYAVTTNSTNELFSCYLTKYLMDETADYYINTKTSISKNNLLMLQKEADSLRRILGGTIVNNASEVDRTFNLNPALQIQRSTIQKGQVNASVIGTAYGEVIKNLELAKINLQRETPLYQIIDSPALPLKADRIPKTYGILIGGFLAAFFTCIVLYFKFLKYRKINITN